MFSFNFVKPASSYSIPATEILNWDFAPGCAYSFMAAGKKISTAIRNNHLRTLFMMNEFDVIEFRGTVLMG
jgi:hypothetical protein